MLNKIQKGKRALITIGVMLIVFSVLASIGAVVCTINAIDRWWMMAIAAVLYLLGILGLIVGITFVWTACAMKATTGNLKEGNIPLEAGTINAQTVVQIFNHKINFALNVAKTQVGKKFVQTAKQSTHKTPKFVHNAEKIYKIKIHFNTSVFFFI